MNLFSENRALELLRLATRDHTSVFREDQDTAIQEILDGAKRVLVVQRTGWGKSFVYFIATKLLREAGSGPVILVSPLLSLMRNQIEAAERMGVVAVEITSANQENWASIDRSLALDQIDILLISPERFSNSEFETTTLPRIAGKVSMLVIDEAHCISDWGHDFRPDYRKIEFIVRQLPASLRVLATTATANNRVLKDLDEVLGGNIKLIRGNLERDSLTLQSIRLGPPAERMAWISKTLSKLEGSGIIYALTVKDAEMLAEWLKSKGFDVEAYTSEEETETKVSLEQKLIKNELKALVATTALGMGFDKPDLAFVVHYQTPPSVVAYYQQVGRAGRSVPSAYGILLSGREEMRIGNWFVDNAFPSRREVDTLLTSLRENPQGLNKAEFASHLNIKEGRVEKVLKILSLERPASIIKDEGKWKLTGIELSNSFWERVERLTTLRREEMAQMQEYVNLPFGAHMKFLVEALDCKFLGSAAFKLLPLSDNVDHDIIKEAEKFIDSRIHSIEPRKRWPKGSFSQFGTGQIPSTLRAEKGSCLSTWGDERISAQVHREKYEVGEFSDKLVNLVTSMINRDFSQSDIAWITSVPSEKHPLLVKSLAQKVAARLNLPYFEAVTLLKSGPQQKEMQNSFYQVQNLDGKFGINTGFPKGNVLLIDDMVDSRWTFTVVSFLLKYEGSGLVFPCALTRVSPSDS